MSLLPLVEPRLLQWEGWNGRRCLFQRRLSHLAGVREDLEPRPPWPLTGKMGTSSLESGSGRNRVSQGCGLRPTLRPLGPERPHPFPFSGLFGFFFPFVLFCTSMEGGTQSCQLFLGFLCTKAKVASGGLLWFKESLFKGKERI